jgi:hypothetical protein
MFPDSIISVCPIWRGIMLSVPKFWRRLVILVDSPATPLSVIISHLWWSLGKPLDVTITRRWNTEDPVDGRLERSRITEIMNILSRHFDVIHELRFDVTFSSSLPSFPSDFHGSAAILDHLELRCRVDDGGRDRDAPLDLSIAEHEEFKCPELVQLVIDGRNYYEATWMDAGWTSKISHIVELTISHFRPHPGESFSAHDLLLPLTTTIVHTLHITEVYLDPSPEELEIDLIHTEFLIFEDMHDSQIIYQIMDWIDPREVSFIRCTFEHDITDPSRRFGYPEYGGALILQDIDQDIAPLIRAFDGYDLRITRCPTFDDYVLGMMTGPEGNRSLAYARYLRSLTLIDCPNFSIAALQRLVESRLHLPCHPGHGIDPTSEEIRIQVLSLAGNLPSMSEAEGAWFEQHVNVINFVKESG